MHICDPCVLHVLPTPSSLPPYNAVRIHVMKLLYSTLKMQAACSSKKSVTTKQTTRFHNQEAHNIKIQNLKTSVSYMKLSIMPLFPSSSYITFYYIQVLFLWHPVLALSLLSTISFVPES